ncbi:MULTISPECIES: DUF4142 domain-containing protein [Nonomuraea]|uniref:DUF4142 domain-containing protein n=2 Tax=Nonomuraea TaxID=83681 RepID=A0ABV5PSZ1_9ACTN|nr:DUF4142 domain-containing protein [Nonomuraea dietziae]MBB3728218.1 putative outer membrane protein [Nonomuraea dietziae]
MRRLLTGEVLLLGGFLVAAAVTVLLVLPGPPAATSTAAPTTSDQDLLIKVRQAGLWEIPTGQQAQQRALSRRVKDVGRHLVEDHLKLDKEVIAVASRLGVVLPSQPSADQQRWMAQLSTKSGAAYDRDFANLLRAAHGKVFSVIALVRAGTRNDEIRRFAQKSNAFVLKHMTLLESTGLVDYDALPEPPTPSPAPAALAADSRRDNQ